MRYKAGTQIIDGGEGTIFEVQGRPDLLMKLYKKNAQGSTIITTDLAEKLEYMKNNPPVNLVAQGSLAWPIEIIYENESLVGFVMPRLAFNSTILQLYAYKNPICDADNYAGFPSVMTRIKVAINLVCMVNELHERDYIIGDFNHENIGINRENGQIIVVDCDSFHITDSDGKTYRTKVVMPGYLAPEIIRHCHDQRSEGWPYRIDDVTLPTFTKESDQFCLAKHIFKLLMNGVDPFTGIIEDTQGSVAYPFQGNEAVERNSYIFKEGYHSNSAFCPASNEIPAYILGLFNRAFDYGHANPGSRPSVREWYVALDKYLKSLTQCQANAKHQYLYSLSYCPFCAADKRHEAVQMGSYVSIQEQVKTETTHISQEKTIKNDVKLPIGAVIVTIIMIIGTIVVFFTSP